MKNRALKLSLILTIAFISFVMGFVAFFAPKSVFAETEEQHVSSQTELETDLSEEVVATLNGIDYDNLIQAFADAVDGDVIDLVSDVSLTEAIKVRADVTLNLNEKTLTLPSLDNYAIVIYDRLTINGDGKVEVLGYYGIGTSTSCTGGLVINGGRFVQENGYYLIGAFGGEVIINDGEFYSQYCILNSFDEYDATAEIYGGQFIAPTDEDGATLYGVNIEVSGGNFEEFISEEYWKDGFVLFDSDFGYIAISLYDYQVMAISELHETAGLMIEMKTYEQYGVNKFYEFLMMAEDEIVNNTFYIEEVDSAVKRYTEMFNLILDAYEYQEAILDAMVEVKTYAEMKKIDITDPNLLSITNLIVDQVTKIEILYAVANAIDVIDQIALDNALALQTAKDDAIATLMGANNENAINVTSSMLASINVCTSTEQVANALLVAQTELSEIVLYKGYIKNASDKADSITQNLSSISGKLTAIENIINANFTALDSKINGAILTINQIKQETASLLATAVDKNQLAQELANVNSAINQVTTDLTNYIRDNVLSAISDYKDSTNDSISALNSSITLLETTFGAKVDDVKDIVDNIKPLTKTDVESILADGLIDIDVDVRHLTNKIANLETQINNATSSILARINDAITTEQATFNNLRSELDVIERILALNFDEINANIDGADASINQIKQDILSLSASSVDKNQLAQELTNINTAINKVTTDVNGHIDTALTQILDAIDNIANNAQLAANKAQIAAEKATEAASKANLASSAAEQAKQAALDAKSLAQEAKQAALDAKASADNASQNASDSLTKAEQAKQSADLAKESAQKAETAANKAAEKAQTAEVKSQATIAEQDLKDWLDDYLESLVQSIHAREGISTYSTAIETDEYRNDLIAKLGDGYSEENAALVLSYYDLALKQINTALSKEEIEFALQTFKTNVKLVDSLNTMATTPTYNDNKVVILLSVVIGVETIIVAVVVILLIKSIKAKKQNDNGPTNGGAPTTETAATTSAEPEVKPATQVAQPATEQPETEEDDEDESSAERGETLTFEERLSASSDIVKEGYQAILNELLSYKKVNSRLSKKAISFRKGRKLIAKMTIVGKTLRVYLALDPKEYDQARFFQRDVSDKKTYEEVPMLMRVKSGRAIKRTIKLIPDIAKKFDLVVKPESRQ